MVFCYKKIAANESEIRFDKNIPDLGDLAIPHAIVSVTKLFKFFCTIHFDILCSISMTKSIYAIINMFFEKTRESQTREKLLKWISYTIRIRQRDAKGN
jgi:hypothetical protein